MSKSQGWGGRNCVFADSKPKCIVISYYFYDVSERYTRTAAKQGSLLCSRCRGPPWPPKIRKTVPWALRDAPCAPLSAGAVATTAASTARCSGTSTACFGTPSLGSSACCCWGSSGSACIIAACCRTTRPRASLGPVPPRRPPGPRGGRAPGSCTLCSAFPPVCPCATGSVLRGWSPPQGARGGGATPPQRRAGELHVTAHA